MYYFTICNPVTLEVWSFGADTPSRALQRTYNLACRILRESHNEDYSYCNRKLYNLCIYRRRADRIEREPAYIVRSNGDLCRVEGFLYESPYREVE